LFGLTIKSTKLKQFSTFSKLLRVKQPVDSIKQQVVFHLVEKTLDFKKVLNHISFKFNKGVDHIPFYSDPTQKQQQHQSFFKHLNLDSSKHLITLDQQDSHKKFILVQS